MAKFLDVPLCYRDNMRPQLLDNEVERWTIGFVGTLSMTQGLQLLIDAMPDIIDLFPKIKVRIVGQGPDSNTIISMVNEHGLSNRFVFHCFIPNDDAMMDIVSKFSLGIATWTDDYCNNIRWADPGKPKLYLALGVPCIITTGPDIAEKIQLWGAGRSISYNKNDLVNAVNDILGSDERWHWYRDTAYKMGAWFTSSKILEPAMTATLKACEL